MGHQVGDYIGTVTDGARSLQYMGRKAASSVLVWPSTSSEFTQEDRIARHMEAILLGGWMHYVTKTSHGSGFPAGTTCDVSFRKTHEHQFFVVVRRKLSDNEYKCGRASDINHPDKVLHFPKPDYWFWPGLEDEAIARKTRGIPRKRIGLRRHVYYTDSHVLKPY